MTCTNFPRCLDALKGCNPECENRPQNGPTVRIARETVPEGTVWTIPAEAVQLLESEMDQ